MNKQLLAIFFVVVAYTFMVGACGDETTVTVVPSKDPKAASKDLRAAVLKDHDTLVVPKPSEDEDGDDYDLKPFLASLHGVAESKIRMSQSESDVEFDTGDCPEDATETYELEYQVDNKDQTLDIECADSAEDLPDSVTKGLLALSDDKIYMYELDGNDGNDDEVAITLGDMLFFLIDSDDLDKTKKLSKQAVRFTGEDEDTESADVGAVLAFGGADVAVTSTDDGGAASGDGYLFVAVHWGEDNGADEAFGLGEDEEDNITKPVSGNNNDDNDDDNNDDNNNGDEGDDGDDGDNGDLGGNNNDDDNNNDDSNDNGDNDDNSDNGDNDNNVVTPVLAAPFAGAKVKAGAAVGSLVLTWSCNAAAADSLYHLASDSGELDSCDAVSVESTPLADRTLAGVHILKKVLGGVTWQKAAYIAAASVTKSGDLLTYTLTGVNTGYAYHYAVAPAKGEGDFSWKEHLTEAQPLEKGAADTASVYACHVSKEKNIKKFVAHAATKTINLCPHDTERCGRKAMTADDGTACRCKYRSISTNFVDGYVLNNLCTNKPGPEITRVTKEHKSLASLPTIAKNNLIGWWRFSIWNVSFNPPYSYTGNKFAFTSPYQHCQKTGNVGDLPSGDLQGDDWCKGPGEERVTYSRTTPFAVAENIRHHVRMRLQAKNKSKGDDGYWLTPWMMDPDAHTRFWGFTDEADTLHASHATTKVLYGGKGNDYLNDQTNAATELTYLIDGFSWDRLGGLEKRLSLTGKTTKIKCEDSSKTLKMVVLSASTFAEASVSDKVTPSTCPVAGTALDDKCFGVRLTIDSNNTLTALSGTGDTAVSGTPDKHLYFKCE